MIEKSRTLWTTFGHFAKKEASDFNGQRPTYWTNGHELFVPYFLRTILVCRILGRLIKFQTFFVHIETR